MDRSVEATDYHRAILVPNMRHVLRAWLLNKIQRVVSFEYCLYVDLLIAVLMNQNGEMA
jgi:hypothetical protein